MLEVINLTKRYGGLLAVDNISFRIPRGQVTGYLGPNGSGKSTTVKMLVGLLRPDRGEILVEGRPVQEQWITYRHRMGYVPEEPHLYPYLTGWEYLLLVGRLRQLPEKTLAFRADALLDLMGLRHQRFKTISGYSKGMRQKILIIAALLSDPDLLVFDEPLSGLDVTSMMVFRHLLQALSAAGKAILYSSHVLEVVEKVCAQVIILDHGRIVADGDVTTLQAMTRQPDLERVFSKLVQQSDPSSVALQMIEVMHA